MRKLSEESIRTEFCDGPVDSPTWIVPSQPEKDPVGYNEGGTCTSDRAELMERIKRGESPTWVPKQAVRRKRRTTWADMIIEWELMLLGSFGLEIGH